MDGLLVVAGVAVAIWAIVRVVRHVRKEKYFASEEFVAHKSEVSLLVQEHNEVDRYASDLGSRGTFHIGRSSTGSNAHLSTYENTSNWNYRRDRNLANFADSNVHNCSLQVVRNASADPIKYIMKYFGIKADEATLVQIEALNDNLSRLESALISLRQREANIVGHVSPPKFVLKHYRHEVMSRVGVELTPITVPYPVYKFEYVSAGGNSAQRAVITLNLPTVDALIETIGSRIRWRKSVAGQRALMTSRLRETIKQRDGYKCLHCSVSLVDEPNLLLEIDHIIPVSRGGMSTPDNLQTLCWRCNRRKSNKVA